MKRAIYSLKGFGSLGLIFGFILASTTAFAVPYKQAKQQQSADYLPLDDVQRFSTAIGQIKNYYVEPINNEELFDDAIRGMLSGLDPHSAYLNQEEYAELKNHTNGKFGGLGIEVGMEDGYIRVVSPIDDTPAHRAGIKAGDLIVRLDGKPVKGMTLRDAVNLMRGERGSSIVLTVIRKNEDKILQFNVERDVIHINSVKNELLEPGYAYIRVSHFQAPTADSLKKALNSLKKQNEGNRLKGLVLDLRNNPGGLLDSAIDVSDTFLDKKRLKNNDLIVFTKGRIRGAAMQVSATPGDSLNGTPIVILVNEGSASGSEIVAGALQDHKRAIVMGTPTFGKGSVQTVLPLEGDRGLKLTTALYYTPAGRSIQATGIKPDIIVTDLDVNMDSGEERDLAVALLREADLDNHLKNGNGHSTKKSDNSKDNDKSAPLAVRDYQLHEALNLLKALQIVSVHN